MSGGSAVLDYGTSTRTIPAPLWSALVVRDEHCRFPGCDRPSVWCEGHHVLHQPGWHAKLRPDGTFEVTGPDGVVRRTSPPRAEILALSRATAAP